jgi:hypothetical protein
VNIPEEPDYFADNSDLSQSNYPNWGTAGGEPPPPPPGQNANNTVLEPAFDSYNWGSNGLGNTSEELMFSYTFPSSTPTGHYYLVVWNDYSGQDPSPTGPGNYRTRRVFSLHVVSSYNLSQREATSPDVPGISGDGGLERIAGVRIRNTTRNQDMVDVFPGSTGDVQYHEDSKTVMVEPGDSINIYGVLQDDFFNEVASWSHNAV